MADGTIAEWSAGTHQRRVAFVVPAGRQSCRRLRIPRSDVFGCWSMADAVMHHDEGSVQSVLEFEVCEFGK